MMQELSFHFFSFSQPLHHFYYNCRHGGGDISSVETGQSRRPLARMSVTAKKSVMKGEEAVEVE